MNPKPAANNECEVMMIRHAPGPAALHFKPRGAGDIWQATLMNVVGLHNQAPIPPGALDLIEGHLYNAVDVVQEILRHRQYGMDEQKLSYLTETPEDTWLLNLYRKRFSRLATPVLKGIEKRVTELLRKNRAIELMARYFPGRTEEISPRETWATVLARFLLYVESEDWFPMDQRIIHIASNVENGEALAEFLYKIPMVQLVPDETETITDPILRIFAGIFNNRYLLRQDDLRPWGLVPSDINEDAVFSGVRMAAGRDWLLPAMYGEMALRFLPTVARMYRRETGFRLLDEAEADPRRNRDGSPIAYFLWDDAARLKQEWAAGAKTMAQRWETFHGWCVDERNFIKAVELALSLAGAGGDL